MPKYRIKYGFEYGFAGVADEEDEQIIEAASLAEAEKAAHEELLVMRENSCPGWTQAEEISDAEGSES